MFQQVHYNCTEKQGWEGGGGTHSLNMLNKIHTAFYFT